MSSDLTFLTNTPGSLLLDRFRALLGKHVATALSKEGAPFKVLGILKREIPKEFFQATVADATRNVHAPREVILSSYIPKT